ncbi:hypothetical protein Hanom_Chr06g00523511 [Helianthus anomalus]
MLQFWYFNNVPLCLYSVLLHADFVVVYMYSRFADFVIMITDGRDVCIMFYKKDDVLYLHTQMYIDNNTHNFLGFVLSPCYTYMYNSCFFFLNLTDFLLMVAYTHVYIDICFNRCPYCFNGTHRFLHMHTYIYNKFVYWLLCNLTMFFKQQTNLSLYFPYMGILLTNTRIHI